MTPHVCTDPLAEEETSDDIPSLVNQDTSIDATIASFRWVLDNGEGAPPEAAYTDPWLSHLYESDSEGEGMSFHSISYNGEAQRQVGSSSGIGPDAGPRINEPSRVEGPDKGVLVWMYDNLK